MTPQNTIDLFGKLLPIVLDVAGLVPGLNIPVNAIKIVQDGIQIEQAIVAMLNSPAGAPIKNAVHRLAGELGLSATIQPNGIIKLEARADVQADLDSGVF
jgi:hypothetical protein